MSSSRTEGFTLIELLVTIAVVAIMATWAVPGFKAFAARNEVNAEVMRIRTALALARNTAVTRSEVVAVCPVASLEATRCDFSNWAQRLVIVEGQADSGDLANTTLLRILEGSGGPHVTFSRQWPVRYQPSGFSSGHNGTFIICGRNGQSSRIIVNNLGRARTDSSPSEC